MKTDKEKTDVIFRIWTNEDFNLVIALFPYEIDNISKGFCMSYEHLGQHSGADYAGVMKATQRAKTKEYNDLKCELESIGYNLRVIRRRNFNRYKKALELAK